MKIYLLLTKIWQLTQLKVIKEYPVSANIHLYLVVITNSAVCLILDRLNASKAAN